MNTKEFFAQIHDAEGRSVKYGFVGVPEECPECKRGQDFDPPYHIRYKPRNIAFGYFQCLFSNCRTPFFGIYALADKGKYHFASSRVPSYSEPVEKNPDIIEEISPEYEKIYFQAHQAEEEGLDLIAGSGYRKALEFLLKDYAIFLIKGDTEEENLTDKQRETIKKVKSSQLGVVIREHLDIPKVKAMASRASWIGNDETHYERRLEESDISIMKQLMKLTVLHIETEELTKEMEDSIQPASKKA
jgi:hypothetical protein